MISGLVATLTADAELAQSARHAIGKHQALEPGQQDGCQLPLVLETATPAESHDLTAWLGELPGVEHVDVVFVHLDEDWVDVPAFMNPSPSINK
jgi:hypothetical protein